MSDRTARLMAQGIERYDSAEEAWESLKELRGEIDWDPEAVRPDATSSVVARYPLSADD